MGKAPEPAKLPSLKKEGILIPSRISKTEEENSLHTKGFGPADLPLLQSETRFKGGPPSSQHIFSD